MGSHKLAILLHYPLQSNSIEQKLQLKLPEEPINLLVSDMLAMHNFQFRSIKLWRDFRPPAIYYKLNLEKDLKFEFQFPAVLFLLSSNINQKGHHHIKKHFYI